jgi:hypothetical protein
MTEARKADWPAALDASLSWLQLAGRVFAGSTSRWPSKERLTSRSALAEARQKYTAVGAGACSAPGRSKGAAENSSRGRQRCTVAVTWSAESNWSISCSARCMSSVSSGVRVTERLLDWRETTLESDYRDRSRSITGLISVLLFARRVDRPGGAKTLPRGGSRRRRLAVAHVRPSACVAGRDAFVARGRVPAPCCRGRPRAQRQLSRLARPD